MVLNGARGYHLSLFFCFQPSFIYKKSGHAVLESGVTPLLHPEGGGSPATASPHSVILKNTDFEDTMLSQVLHDLWFSLNQSPE